MIFERLFRRHSSGTIAKDRLKLLLVSDRADCSPETMDLLKNDIIVTISKYMDINIDNIDIKITKTKTESGYSPTLYANIPINTFKNKNNGVR